MTTDRRIITRVGSIFAAALAIAAAMPLTASAGPLLSGYGGPGQGNQAILGSTLLGGSGGGSSGGSGSGGSGAETSAQPGGAAGLKPAGGGSRSAHLHRAGALSGTASAGGFQARSYPAVESTSGASDSLGLSGADILYIILAAVALAFTGALTKVVAGTRTAKGH